MTVYSGIYYAMYGVNIGKTVVEYIFSITQGTQTVVATLSKADFEELMKTAMGMLVISGISADPVLPAIVTPSSFINTTFTSTVYPINVSFFVYDSGGVIVNNQGPTEIISASSLPISYIVPSLSAGDYTLKMLISDAAGCGNLVNLGVFTIEAT